MGAGKATATTRSVVGDAQVRGDLSPNQLDRTSANKAGGPNFYALNIATVVRVDYGKMEVNLRVQTGETFQRVAIPLSFPGAGHRHFLGAVPECGDVCVIGYGMQESGRTRAPYILSWLVPGVTAGYDWLPTQPFGTDEYNIDPKKDIALEGVADRKRHKFRHLEPGNVFGSSAQGADILLDEGVMLANRRGGEFRIRDQDNAIIMRSLQQFHAGAGFRVYSGMVQRDATLLPTQLFSDGTWWDAPLQADIEGLPYNEDELGESQWDLDALTPAGVFQRSNTSQPAPWIVDGVVIADRDGDGSILNDLSFPADLDPYEFLQRGLFISPSGYARGDFTSDTIYGGKPLFRVARPTDDGVLLGNAVGDPQVDTLTEFRIEVAHTADGTRPVTEQTDGFDASRLPSGSPRDADPDGASVDTAYIEWVMGSVVGNDPFTESGRAVYGLPLRPVVFDGDVRNPVLATAVGSPIDAHSATLFKLSPPTGAGGPPTWWSVTKDGRLFGSIAGPGDAWSSEFSLGAGMRMGSGRNPNGESFSADMQGSFTLRARAGRNLDNVGIDLRSEGGAVKIYGGISSREGGPGPAAAPVDGGGETATPAVTIESATNLLLKAKKNIQFYANKLDFSNVSAMSFNASDAFTVQSSNGISHSSKTSAHTTTGQATNTYSGPKDNLPTNGPLRSGMFAPVPPVPAFPVDVETILAGTQAETILAGNHLKTVTVGNQVYSVGTGSISLLAPPTALVVSNAGIAGTGPTVAFAAQAGAAALTATTQALIAAPTVTVTAPIVNFVGPGHLPPGAMLTDGCINPLTGTPFALSGVLGVQTIRVI
jgi:hypothetical protein